MPAQRARVTLLDLSLTRGRLFGWALPVVQSAPTKCFLSLLPPPLPCVLPPAWDPGAAPALALMACLLAPCFFLSSHTCYFCPSFCFSCFCAPRGGFFDGDDDYAQALVDGGFLKALRIQLVGGWVGGCVEEGCGARWQLQWWGCL